MISKDFKKYVQDLKTAIDTPDIFNLSILVTFVHTHIYSNLYYVASFQRNMYKI